MTHANRSAVLQPLDAGNLAIASEVVSASGLSTTREELQRQWSLPDATLVGAWQDGRLVGVAGAISYGTSGVIGPMSVLPELQGSGIGV